MSEDSEAHRRLRRVNELLRVTQMPGWKEFLVPELEARIETLRSRLEKDLEEKETTETRARIKELRWLLRDVMAVDSLEANAKSERAALGG